MSAQDLEQRAHEVEWATRSLRELWEQSNKGWEAQGAVRQLESFIAAAMRAAPDGYVLVPVEPTDEMCAAAFARIKEVTVVIDAGPAKGATLVRDPYYHAYKAMLAALAQGVQS